MRLPLSWSTMSPEPATGPAEFVLDVVVGLTAAPGVGEPAAGAAPVPFVARDHFTPTLAHDAASMAQSAHGRIVLPLQPRLAPPVCAPSRSCWTRFTSSPFGAAGWPLAWSVDG